MITEQFLSKLNSEDLNSLKRIINLITDNRPKVNIELQDFTTEYLKFSEQSFSTKYTKSIKISLSYLLKEFGDHKLLSEITSKDIEHFIIKLKKNAPKGIKVYFRNLKAAFNKALDWEYLTYNPFLKIKIQKTMETKPDFINDKELKEILSKVNNKVIRDIILTAYYTGCRLNEIISLKVKHIDYKEKLITIGDEESQTKNKKQRKIPINEKLMEILIKRLEDSIEDDMYLFPKTSGYKYDGDYVSKIFKRAVRAAGIRETVHFHSLRHSFGSNLGLIGVPLITVKELMGHSSITTTQIYSHTTLCDMRNAISKLN